MFLVLSALQRRPSLLPPAGWDASHRMQAHGGWGPPSEVEDAVAAEAEEEEGDGENEGSEEEEEDIDLENSSSDVPSCKPGLAPPALVTS